MFQLVEETSKNIQTKWLYFSEQPNTLSVAILSHLPYVFMIGQSLSGVKEAKYYLLARAVCYLLYSLPKEIYQYFHPTNYIAQYYPFVY